MIIAFRFCPDPAKALRAKARGGPPTSWFQLEKFEQFWSGENDLKIWVERPGDYEK
jgi:hypothetical protein